MRLCDFGFSRSIKTFVKESSGHNNRQQRAYSKICMTRYFRSPEIIFQQNSYDERTDLWSFGCLASQLIKHMQEPNLDIRKKILFKGNSCYPISPGVDGDEKKLSSRDQTIQILRVLGKSQPLTQSFFTNQKMNKFYQMCLDRAVKSEDRGLKKIHEGVNPDFISLLSSCLKIDISNRATVEELLQNPLFDEIRNPHAKLTQAPSKIEIRIDQMELNEGMPHEYSIS